MIQFTNKKNTTETDIWGEKNSITKKNKKSLKT